MKGQLDYIIHLLSYINGVALYILNYSVNASNMCIHSARRGIHSARRGCQGLNLPRKKIQVNINNKGEGDRGGIRFI